MSALLQSLQHDFFSPSAVLAQARLDVARALQEDIGSGDLTAQLINADKLISAYVVTREAAVIAGSDWFNCAFHMLDERVQVEWLVPEGGQVQANTQLVRLHGPARALLSAERTGLNFLQLLSAVATRTAAFVNAIADLPQGRAHIVDTRKTLPGLRWAQKYAVKAGGGDNHRMGLFDAILIKENHIAAAGGISQALYAAQLLASHARFVQIEVETLSQLEQALAAGAQMVLLDNMSLSDLRQAVQVNRGRALLEVSGGVNLDTVRDIAATGVDRISIGTLTKDIKAIDFSMRME